MQRVLLPQAKDQFSELRSTERQLPGHRGLPATEMTYKQTLLNREEGEAQARPPAAARPAGGKHASRVQRASDSSECSAQPLSKCFSSALQIQHSRTGTAAKSDMIAACRSAVAVAFLWRILFEYYASRCSGSTPYSTASGVRSVALFSFRLERAISQQRHVGT